MRIACLFFVAGCHSPPSPATPPPAPSPPAPVECADTWLLLHSLHGCADKINSVSGYRVLEVVDGAQRGKLVVVPYSPLCPASVSDWNLSRHVTFGPLAANDCHFGGPDCHTPPINDGVVETWQRGAIEAFLDEASARASRERRCASQ